MAYKSLNNIDARHMNRNRVYRLVYDRGGISKPEIAQQLGISLPTAIQNVKMLQEDGLLLEGEALESTGGRKAVAVTCNANARYAIGIDITRNHIRIVVINLKAEIIFNNRIHAPFHNSSEYFSQLGDLINETVKENAIEPEKILGVGVSIPGILSADHQLLIHSHALNISGLECSRLMHSVPYPSVLCNDANAAGLAELWSDHANKNAVYLSLSNTVGGAIILGEDLYYGDSQRSGEFGHMTLVKDGLPCYCGKKGCLDTYCSAQVLSQHTNDSLDVFFEKLKDGDSNIKKIWDQYLGWLATAINNLTVFFDCKIILGGYLGSYLGDYIDDLQKLVSELTTFPGNERYATVCTHQMDAASVGAALLFVRPFIEQI